MDKAQLPKYQQVMETIKGKISKGEWPIGSKIPSQRKLAEEFGVNRSTIITALEELAADGLLEGKTGSAQRLLIIHGLCSLPGSLPAGASISIQGYTEPAKKSFRKLMT